MRYVALTLCAAAMASAAVAPAVAVAPVLADEDSGGLAGLARGDLVGYRRRVQRGSAAPVSGGGVPHRAGWEPGAANCLARRVRRAGTGRRGLRDAR